MVGNGQHLDITQIGNISIPIDYYPIKLNSTLVVSRIAKNLLSISRLTKDNILLVEFNVFSCILNEPQENHLLQGKLEKRFYKLSLPCNKIKSRASSFFSTPLNLRGSASQVKTFSASD